MTTRNEDTPDSEAVKTINEALGIQGTVTFKGDEFKGGTPSEGGDCVSKAYFNAKDCRALAAAFAALADELEGAIAATAAGEE